MTDITTYDYYKALDENAVLKGRIEELDQQVKELQTLMERNDTCKWIPVHDRDEQYAGWDTECGGENVFWEAWLEHPTPYCPYCGGNVVEVLE